MKNSIKPWSTNGRASVLKGNGKLLHSLNLNCDEKDLNADDVQVKYWQEEDELGVVRITAMTVYATIETDWARDLRIEAECEVVGGTGYHELLDVATAAIDGIRDALLVCPTGCLKHATGWQNDVHVDLEFIEYQSSSCKFSDYSTVAHYIIHPTF